MGLRGRELYGQRAGGLLWMRPLLVEKGVAVVAVGIGRVVGEERRGVEVREAAGGRRTVLLVKNQGRHHGWLDL